MKHIKLLYQFITILTFMSIIKATIKLHLFCVIDIVKNIFWHKNQDKLLLSH